MECAICKKNLQSVRVCGDCGRHVCDQCSAFCSFNECWCVVCEAYDDYMLALEEDDAQR